MRIVYFADIRFPLERANGIQTMETCYALAARGHRVDLVVRPDTHDPPRDPWAFYGLDPLSSLAIVRAPVMGSALMRRVGYLNFALGRALGSGHAVIAYTRDLGLAALLLRLPRGWRPPAVYESHGYAPDVAAALPSMIATAQPPSPRKQRRLAAREAQVWRRADGYVTITGGLADDLTRRLGARARLAVAPDGVREDRVTVATAPLPGRRPVVGYAGHLYAWKGVDILLAALARVPDAEGLIIGGHDKEPDLGRVRALAATLGIADRVTFTGHLPPGEVPALLATTACLVLPNPASALSSTSTSPLKLFEYMASGRPIVASSLPALREVLRDGENAVLVEAGNAESLARGIQQVIERPEEAARLARAARADVASYTWARRAETLERLLVEVEAERR